MDKNTVWGLIIIFAVLIIYSYWMSPSKEMLEKQKRIQDSLVIVQQKADSIAKIQEVIKAKEKAQKILSEKIIPNKDILSADTKQIKANNRDKLGVFANSGSGVNKTYTLENDLMKIKISSKGGKIISVRLKKYQTFDSLPLQLFDPDSSKFGFEFFANNRYINTNELYFKPYYYNTNSQAKDSIKVSGTDSISFAMRLYTDASDTSYNLNKYIEFLYTIRGDDYMIDYKVNFKGMQGIISSNTDYINLIWSANLQKQEKTISKYDGPTIYYKYFHNDVKYLSETKDDKKSLKTRLRWISFKQQFFSSTLITDNNFVNADVNVFTEHKHNNRYLRSMKALIGVPYTLSGVQKIPMHFYFGPNKYKTLRHYNIGLERQIPLGWSFFLMAWINRFAVIPIFNFLEGFNLNYGIIILILTILLKLFLFPITYKTYSSSAKMRVLKPEIDEISKKYPKKEDMMKKQQATMALYKRAGVNPMAGCLPMLLQFPILIAMFRFFPASFELRQQSFLWATDLSSYDSIWNFPNGFSIPFYGDHVSLFTLLMTISTIFYTKINNDMMGSSSNQMPGMKTMSYLMPIMFLGIFNNYSAGLSYYYLLANIITFAQMYFIRKYIDEDKLRKKLLSNKNKNVKKSGFQKRLELMAKQKGYNPKTGKRRY